MRSVHVVTSADSLYARHLGVMLTSLFSSSAGDAAFTITVLDGGISRKDIGRLTRLAERYCARISFVVVDRFQFERYPLSNHIRQAAYYRISVADMLDPTVRKVLYLDCDIIIKGDIAELWDTDIDGYTVAAVEDPNFNRNEELLLPKGALYFNSGVILINLDRWRANRIGQKAHDFILKHPEVLQLHDQDALNAVLNGEWLPLHPKWNMQTDMLGLSPLSSYPDQAVLEAVTSPAVIHYTTSSKPWHYMNEHRYRSDYYRFLHRTEWKPKFPKIHQRFRTMMKPILAVVYNLMDIVKSKRAGYACSMSGCTTNKDNG